METSTSDTVTDWLGPLKEGSHEAAGLLFDRYIGRMTGVARSQLRGASRGHLGGDEEDVAQAAFIAFCQAAGQGQFSRLDDRADLWRLLATITRRKAARLLEREGRQKRGGPAANYANAPRDLDDLPGREPDPALRVATVEQLRHYFELLGDDGLGQVAVLKMEGYSHGEIAARVGCVERSVSRKIRAIRLIWTQDDRP